MDHSNFPADLFNTNMSAEQIANPQTNEEAFQASLLGLLEKGRGYYVIVEFLIGTQNMVIKDGILTGVGNNFITLYQEEEDRYVVCDLFSVKFVNFYDARSKPRNIRPFRQTV